METKTCSKCGRELPLSEFHKYERLNETHYSQCRDCKAELTTNEKGSLVGAINENNTLISSNSQFTDTNDTVYSWRLIKSTEGIMQLEYTEVI